MADEQAKGKGMEFIREAVGEMPMGRKLAVLGGGALLMGLFVSLLLWINQPQYKVLFSGLGQRDAAQVVAKLKDIKVPYSLSGDGGTISVPEEQIHEARLALAAEGLPRGQGVGFEVFNKVDMGTTEFVQKINYQRALEGELARTIASFAEVREARVHIVMPRDSLFVEEEKKPSAAVVVDLNSGRTLSANQLAGVVNLVASAVPDLTDERVTVVDTRGNLLYKKQADTPGFAAGLTASQLDYQRNFEKQLRSKVETMLEQVLGPGRAVVRVASDIDFTRTQTTEDLFNPDQVAVRSESRNSDSSRAQGQSPIGSPDQRFNLAQQNATPSEGKEQSVSSREGETTNYEISRTQRQISKAIGGLKRLTVAVVVDGPYKEEKGEGGQITRTFTPRTAEEMRQLTEIVRRAVGYNESRGDEVTLANVPFATAGDLGVAAGRDWQDYLREYARPMLNLVLGLAFILLVLRPLIRHYLASRAREVVTVTTAPAGPMGRRVGPGEELPGMAEGLGMEEAGLLEEGGPRKPSLREQIMALAMQDPDRTTAVLRAWIRQA
ncbi:MAG: flagellar M-ring protein FliF [Desulfarculus sp.]|nr:flagellar M-ring protein FliF [Desulfarculus sp.]